MEIDSHKKIVVEKLISKGFSKEQAEGFVVALEDTDLARQVNQLTGTVLAFIATDIATDLIL